jgi:gluconate 2-dehydrogenase gamma chain
MKKLTRRSVIATTTIVPLAAIRTAAQPIPQMALLEAAVDRIIPPDDLGPGAKQCGAANYIAPLIDKAFQEGLAAIDAEARAKLSKPFADLTPPEQDEVLGAVEAKSRPFFNRLRELTIQGTFSDPSYGGNRSFGGWDLIRYPGPRLAVGPEEQKMRDAIKPVRRSAANGH